MRLFCFCSALVALFALSPACDAGLVFEKKNYEVTSGIHDMKMTFEFPFVNKSSKPVEIKKVETSCSCLTARVPDNEYTSDAGEAGKVILDIDLGAFGGKVEKDAVVVTSEGERIPLKLVVHVPEFVKMEPKTLKWTINEALTPKKIRLKINKELNLKLKDVSISKTAFEFQPKTIEAGREYEITITPKTTETPEFALISVTTDSTEPRYKKIMGFLSIAPKSDKK